MRGLRPEAASYDAAATNLQTLWVAVRACLREVLDEVSIADVVSGRLPAARLGPRRQAGRVAAPLRRATDRCRLGLPRPASRQFGRRRQSHDCEPAMTLEEYFSTGPERERPIFDAVMQHLATVGPVHVEPVSVGIFLKRSRTFAELRPMQRWVALSFSLPRPDRHPRITRKVVPYDGRYFHVANLRDADDLDDEITGLADRGLPEQPRVRKTGTMTRHLHVISYSSVN